jgi:hypothetical protein
MDMRGANAARMTPFFLASSLWISVAAADREKVVFPEYQKHVLYDVIEQPDIQEIREAYINSEGLKNVKSGQPFPSGTVITMPTFKALLDEKGNFVRDVNGRLVRGRL